MKLTPALAAAILAATAVQAFPVQPNEALSKLHLRSGLEANAATLQLKQRGADVKAINDHVFIAGDTEESQGDRIVQRGFDWLDLSKLNPVNWFKSPTPKFEGPPGTFVKIKEDEGWPYVTKLTDDLTDFVYLEKLNEKDAKPFLDEHQKELKEDAKFLKKLGKERAREDRRSGTGAYYTPPSGSEKSGAWKITHLT